MIPDRVVVVKKQTDLEQLLRRMLTVSQVKFYLEAGGHSYESYRSAHDAYHHGLESALLAVSNKARMQVIDRDDVPAFMFGDNDLVVAVGGTGMVINVAKYTSSQPIIALNPDESREVSVLCTCNPSGFEKTLKAALDGKAVLRRLTMAEAVLDNGQSMYAVNDLFIGRSDHVSARYMLSYNGRSERQSSSGIIVSTGAGSTGWLSSIVGGANSIVSGSWHLSNGVPFDPEAEYLMFAVREPFVSQRSGGDISFGCVDAGCPLVVASHIGEYGVVFSDGIIDDYIEFNAGRTAFIRPAARKANLVCGQPSCSNVP